MCISPKASKSNGIHSTRFCSVSSKLRQKAKQNVGLVNAQEKQSFILFFHKTNVNKSFFLTGEIFSDKKH